MRKKLYSLIALLLAAVMLISACGQSSDTGETEETTEETTAEETSAAAAEEEDTEETEAVAVDDSDAPYIEGLTFESQLDLEYAEAYDVYFYEGGYALITVYTSAAYLLVPEGGEVPANLDEQIIVLQQPLDTIYMVASSAMSLFDSIDALDSIRLSGTQASGWYYDDAHIVDYMEAGNILYAGKYSEPDYELLVSENCDIAIESTMILHTPKVQEMIELLGIPVFIDRSSYETHPLGRTEWIKLYGVMVGKLDEAEAFFDDQAEVIKELENYVSTDVTVAYFNVNTEGTVEVRRASDYISSMITLGGAQSVFDYLDGDSAYVSISFEEFYNMAVDADYLIYNASIDSSVTCIDDLLAKDELFEDFKAVQNGNVFTTGRGLYQATSTVGQLITDINIMINEGDESQMTFLSRLE